MYKADGGIFLLFAQVLKAAGLPTPKNYLIKGQADVERAAAEVGFPASALHSPSLTRTCWQTAAPKALSTEAIGNCCSLSRRSCARLCSPEADIGAGVDRG